MIFFTPLLFPTATERKCKPRSVFCERNLVGYAVLRTLFVTILIARNKTSFIFSGIARIVSQIERKTAGHVFPGRHAYCRIKQVVDICITNRWTAISCTYIGCDFRFDRYVVVLYHLRNESAKIKRYYAVNFCPCLSVFNAPMPVVCFTCMRIHYGAAFLFVNLHVCSRRHDRVVCFGKTPSRCVGCIAGVSEVDARHLATVAFHRVCISERCVIGFILSCDVVRTRDFADRFTCQSKREHHRETQRQYEQSRCVEQYTFLSVAISHKFHLGFW